MSLFTWFKNITKRCMVLGCREPREGIKVALTVGSAPAVLIRYTDLCRTHAVQRYQRLTLKKGRG